MDISFWVAEQSLREAGIEYEGGEGSFLFEYERINWMSWMLNLKTEKTNSWGSFLAKLEKEF